MDMGFPTKAAVEYDPHSVISNRRKVVNRKPFKHVEVVGLEDAANWDDYPKENPNDTNRKEDSSSSVKYITSLMPDVSKVVSAAINITPLASHLEKRIKWDILDHLEIEDEDTSITPKRKNIKVEE